jgi:hypothetical protein
MSKESKKTKKVIKIKRIEEATETDSGEKISRVPFGEVFVGSDTLRLHNDHYVDKLYEAAADVIKGFKAKENVLADVIVLTTTLMEGVKVYPGVTGPEKKVIVLRVVRKVLSEIEMDKSTSSALLVLVDMVLPAAIDVIFAAASGKFSFKKGCGCM